MTEPASEKTLIAGPESYGGPGFDALLRMVMRAAGASVAAVILSDDRGVWVQASMGLPPDHDVDWSFVFRILALGRTCVFDRDTLAEDADGTPSGNAVPGLGQFCVAAPFQNPAGSACGLLLVADHEPLLATPEIVTAVEDAAEIASGMVDLIGLLHEQRVETRRDSLTGLSNRTMFNQRLQRILVRPDNQCAILYVDIDGFKQVNDLHGHAAGDELLRQMAHRIRQVAGAAAWVARLGGDEFALIVEGAGAAGIATTMGRAIIRRAREPFLLQTATLSLSVSLGLALCPEDSADWRTLVRCAEAALYRAKNASGSRRLQRYEVRLDAPFVQRTDLDPHLRRALARDELRVYWQKRVNAQTWVTEMREALLRWVRPGHGLMLPDRFVPGAESSGTVALLDRFVLREASRQAVTWPESIGIAVNISPRWFRRGHLVRMVSDALADSGLAPARLQLEVTEKVLMTDADPVLRTMERLKALGVGLGLDDFGTVYSSLAYLARFPFDTIKLDRSFVASICEDPRSLAVGRAIIQLGRSLGMVICAEGVETTHQRDLLLVAGVDEFQGFLFGRPVEIPD